MEARKTATSRSAQDAIAMLKADHQRVHALCAQFERASDASDDVDRKQRLAERICQELEVHAQLEEELFYPAVRAAIGDAALMDEAQVEHQSAMDLIRQIRSMSPGDALFDAKVKVLGEYVDHHVKEEEGGMFPKARKARVDLADLARRMAQRRTALESEHSMEPFDLISSMLMRPIRAAASAVRAGATAGRRAVSGAARATASAGTGRGRKAAGTGARRGTTAASSTTRAVAGTGASASPGAKRGAAGRTAAVAKGGRASKSGGRAAASAGTGRKAAASGARRSRTTR
jgi:hemerythrin superfamily protein